MKLTEPVLMLRTDLFSADAYIQDRIEYEDLY